MSYPPHCLADARAFQRYLDAVTSLNDAATLADHIGQAQEAVRDARRSARLVDALLANLPPLRKSRLAV